MANELVEWLDVEQSIKRRAPKIDHVLYGLPAGEAGMVVGPGGVGKSFLLLQLAISVATGITMLGDAWSQNQKPGKVLYLAGEDPVQIIWERLHNAANKLPRFHGDIVTNLRIASTSGKAGGGYLLESTAEGIRHSDLWQWLLDQATGCRLIIIDPLRRFHALDENNSADATTIVKSLEEIAAKSGAAVIATHHTNKLSSMVGGGDLQQASRGSSAFTDAVRWQANLIPMSKSECGRVGVHENERRMFVRLSLSKTNYAAFAKDLWFKRGNDGVLETAQFKPIVDPMLAINKKEVDKDDNW